jgi:hypothetical protein
MTIKPGHQTSGNAQMIWSNELSFMVHPTRGRVYIWRTAKEAYNMECLVPTVKHGGSPAMIWAAISWYSVGPIITPPGRITVREYMDRLGNQVHPMIWTLFPYNETLFEYDNATTHTAGTVQLWFEEHESNL